MTIEYYPGKPLSAPLPVPTGYTPPTSTINPQIRAELNLWLGGAASIASQVQYAQPEDSLVRAEMDVLLQVLYRAREVLNR